ARRGAGAPGLMDGCALPQKDPARAGVMMITTPPVEEVAPPGAPGSASAAEGIAGVRQAPLGQKAYPPQDGDEARARDEAAPGAGGAGGPAGSGAAQRAPAEGMGGSAAPTLLDLDRKFRQEANARIDAQQAASALAELAADTVDAVRKANEQGYLFVKNAKTLDDFQRKSRAITEQLGQAERGMSGPEYGTFSGDLHGAVRSAISLLAEVALQGEGAKGEILAASFHLTATDDVARRAVATLNELWRQKRRIRELGRTLGSMDGSSLRRLALAAEHRAERDAYRAERRALRRERGGAFKARQFADVTAATERAFGFETKAARYQAEADRARKGSAARARAQRNADYYGSLAEAERHHASVARSHIVGAEIGRTKAAREFLKQERANADAHYRNEQKIAKLERLRAQEAQRLERVTAQLDALVAKDEQGNAKKEDGKYVPKHPRDRLKVEQLAKEQEREQQRRGQRTAEIVKLQGENRGLAPSGPFAGTPAGTRLALLRYARVNAYPPKLVRQIAASVNSMMSQVIADASARSSAALDAGFAAARAMYDPFLSPDQRADAAASYVAALAAAEQAVRDISDAIVIKSRNELQGLADYDDEELAQDMAALAAARARLKQLQDPCNACSQKCESNASWICWWERPDPPPFGDPNAPTRGDGSSISSADSSAPGGVEAVAPQGSSESDGSDEPEAETDGTTEARKEEEKAVEPTEAEDDRPRSVAPEKKEEEKKKVTVPDVEVPDVFRQAVGGVTTFAMNVRAGIEDAVGSARAAFREVGRFLDEAAKEAERDTAALDEIKKQEIKRLQDLLTATVQNLMRRIEIAASRGESEAAIEKTIAILRLAKSQLLAQLASMGDGRDPELYRQLKQQYMQVEPTIMGLEEQRRRLESDDSFESTEARQVIVKVLRAELAVVTNLSIRALWAAKDRESVEDAATRLELRMQWARSVADHAYFASLGVQSEEEQVGERSSVADRYAGSVGSIAPPDFARDSIERIKQQIGAYDRKIADFGRQVAKAADERTDRKRVATVALAAAAVAASVLTVGAVAPLALPVGLKAAIIGAAVAGGGDIIRQGAQIIDDPTREFKWGQVGWAYVGGAVAAPVLVVAPELAAALSIYGGATAVKEIREGHYATGFLDAAMSAAPFLSGAGRAQMFGKGTIFDEGGTAGIAERLGRLKLPGQPPVRPPAINLAGEGEIPGVVNQNIKIIMDPAWRTSRGGLTLSEVRALSYNPKFVVSANERLPFRSDYFQTVYTNSAPIDKTTIFGPGVVPSEVIRVLRPGGQWIVDGQVYFTK
ncbi:MAG TPA: hypothetical protein VFY93_07760, partial [Planctomycetota bacterium]|nr:hypothetical protein [Planctomycetota bacterium]